MSISYVSIMVVWVHMVNAEHMLLQLNATKSGDTLKKKTFIVGAGGGRWVVQTQHLTLKWDFG